MNPPSGTIAPHAASPTPWMRFGLRRALLNRGPRILFACYVFALCLFAWLGHPMEDGDFCNPELDNYCDLAESISAGRIPKDPFHPMLFPMLGAALKPLLASGFRACQAISLASGIGFVWFAWLLARRLGSRRRAVLMAALVAINNGVIIASVRAASDMLFQMLTLGVVVMLHAFWLNPPRATFRKWLAVGLFTGLAWSTRYMAVMFLPLIFLTIGRTPIKSWVAGLTGVILGSLIAMAPQFAVNWQQFGDPLYNDNWQNIVGFYSDQKGNGITASVIAATPADRAKLLVDMLDKPRYYARFIAAQVWNYMEFRALPDLAGTQVGGIVTAVLFFLSTGISLITWRPDRLFLSFTALFLAAAVGVSFPLAARFILPTIALIWLSALSWHPRNPFSRGIFKALITLLAFGTVIGNLQVLSTFSGTHTRDDLLIGQSIAKNDPKAMVCGTSPFLSHHFPFTYSRIMVPKSDEFDLLFIALTFKTILLDQPDFLIVNATGCYNLPTPEVLRRAPNSVFPFLVPLQTIGESRSFIVSKKHPFFHQGIARQDLEHRLFAVKSTTSDLLSWENFALVDRVATHAPLQPQPAPASTPAVTPPKIGEAECPTPR